MDQRTGFQVNGQEHDAEEKRKRLLHYLRLREDGWPKAVLEKRTKLNRTRAKKLAKQFGIAFE